MHTVSVAMAVYNGEKYIVDQIDSIICQLGDNDELVVSYDASTDNTWGIVERYALQDRRVKLHRNTGSGVASNFNNAIRHCKGDFIFISDQDDVWMPGKVGRIIRAFEETDADLVIHNGVHTDEHLKPLAGTFFETSRMGSGKIRNLVKSRYSGCCMAFASSVRGILLPIPSDIDAYDRWIGLVCEFVGKVVYIDDVLIRHRLHDRNVTPKTTRPLPVIVWSRINMIRHLLARLVFHRHGIGTC